MSPPAPPPPEPRRRLIAALTTFHRPGELTDTLDRVARQTRPPDVLIVVDNGRETSTRAIIDGHHIGAVAETLLLTPDTNLGPVGGYGMAFDHVRGEAGADDLFMLLDDDDPPVVDTAFEDLTDVACRLLVDPRTAGVALRGGALDLRTGFIRARPSPDAGQVETQLADHLHGSHFPTYRVEALRLTEPFDRSYFWGFDDLELGRCLARNGLRVYVTPQLLASMADAYPTRPRVRITADLAETSWRHYYRHRNLLRTLKRDRAWTGIAVVLLVRLLAKPLMAVPYRPRLAVWHLRTNIRAVRDGLGPHRRMLADSDQRPVEPETVAARASTRRR